MWVRILHLSLFPDTKAQGLVPQLKGISNLVDHKSSVELGSRKVGNLKQERQMKQQVNAILVPVAIFDRLDTEPESIGTWKNPDPKEFPYIVFRTEDYIKLQTVFDEFGCRQAIRDTKATVYTVPAEAVCAVDSYFTLHALEECSVCETNETKEWYKTSEKLLICQDCYTAKYKL